MGLLKLLSDSYYSWNISKQVHLEVAYYTLLLGYLRITNSQHGVWQMQNAVSHLHWDANYVRR